MCVIGLCQRLNRVFAVLGLVVLGVALPAAPSRAADPRPYRAVELGGVDGRAIDVNDRGQVVGYLFDPDGNPHPFLWQRGTLTDLGGLGAGSLSGGTAVAINNRGQVVGGSTVDGGGGWMVNHAFLWQRGVMTELGTLGGAISFASGINDQGLVWGSSATETIEEWHGFLWRDGVMEDLGRASVADANNHGQMVGSILRGDGYQPVLWDRGRVIDLPFEPRAINDRGWVVGVSQGGDDRQHAYLWRSGTVTELGMLDPDRPYGGATPVDINNRGQVLGMSNVSKQDRPFLWQRGTMIDLTGYGIPASAEVHSLNDRGDIVGTSHSEAGFGRAVLFRRD